MRFFFKNSTVGHLLAVIMLFGCANPPQQEQQRDPFPPLVKGSGTLSGVSFHLPVPLVQIHSLERNPVNGKVIHRYGNKDKSQYIVFLCETNAPVIAPAAGEVRRIRNMPGNPVQYEIELLHRYDVKSLIRGVIDPTVKIGSNLAAQMELGRTRGRLEVSLWVDLNGLSALSMDRYIYRVRKGGHWKAVFPLLLFFGKGVYDAKDYR